MADRAPLSGEIYLERKVLEQGNFTSTSVVSEIYWKCTVGPEGSIKMTMLDMEGDLTGHHETVGRAVFNNRFMHQPGYEEMMRDPVPLDVKPILTLADHHYQRAEYNSAEYEYARALGQDPQCVAARFGLGRVYLARGEQDRATEVFSQLNDAAAAGQPEHKHICNDIAIELRKAGMIREAVDQYRHALEVTNDDEHLWFNLGRVLSEHGQGELAVRLMEKAIQINPDFQEARLYLESYLGDQPAARQALQRLAAAEDDAPGSSDEGLLSIAPGQDHDDVPLASREPSRDEDPIITLDF
jgi:tetratricopeptide (TPR) repeat protein